jgi:hypothetical protein
VVAVAPPLLHPVFAVRRWRLPSPPPEITSRRIFACLAQVVSEDLETDFYANIQPPAEFATHREQCLLLSVLRAPGDDKVKAEVAESLRVYLNGDWKVARVQHFCWRRHRCRFGKKESQYLVIVVVELCKARLLQRRPKEGCSSQDRIAVVPG